jgi:hypothetical protein
LWDWWWSWLWGWLRGWLWGWLRRLSQALTLPGSFLLELGFFLL